MMKASYLQWLLLCYGDNASENLLGIVIQFNNNGLSEWKDIDLLQPCKAIDTVYFEHNPIYKDAQYRRKLKLALPSLKQIDATMVRQHILYFVPYVLPAV